MSHRYAGMVLIYCHQAGCCYKKQLEQDLQASQWSINEAVDYLVCMEYMKPTKGLDGRVKEYYEMTLEGSKVATALLNMVTVSMECKQHLEARKRAKSRC